MDYFRKMIRKCGGSSQIIKLYGCYPHWI